jgi:thioredoxin 1
MITLLHFTADWCQPCKKMKPLIDEVIKNNPDIFYNKIDIEEDFDTAKAYNVMSIPTLIVLNGEEIYSRHTGLADITKIQNLFPEVVK